VSVDLRRGLASIVPPDEAGAERRAWAVVRGAFGEREPTPLHRGFLRPLIALAAVAAVVAAALSPPGRAVLDDIRDAIAPTRVERAAPAVFSLPAPGRLLVDSSPGVWVVQADGSKRLLPGYREASWSPHGLYVVAARRNQLAAIDPDAGPDSRVRWTLSRPDIRSPRWGGTLTDTRIAYFTTRRGLRSLRVVAGDGKGDHWVAKDVFDVPPAWRPGAAHVLALAHIDGRIRIWSDTRALLGTSPRGERPVQLAWSSDGKRLLALGPRRLRIFDRSARLTAVREMPRGWTATAMAARPGGSAVAVVRSRGARSEVVVFERGRERQAFAGTGTFSGVQWSPNGSRLLVSLEDADQWLFIRWGRVVKFDAAASNIAGEFESDRFPVVAGWCCAG
jgi:IKI3 family